MRVDARPRRRPANWRARIGVGIAAALVAACAAPRAPSPETAAPLILISIDGFHPDYLTRGLTPTLASLAAHGARARWMAPTFPTKTFPQHYTIVTGLYPSRHGIVANSFVDERDGGRFGYWDTTVAFLPRWWGGEPIWLTAQRQGLRSGTMFWPGSEAEIDGERPSRWKRFDIAMPDEARVDTLLAWLALSPAERPTMLTLYFDGVDHWGHETGPDSPQLDGALRRADAALARLLDGLARLGLRDRANIVIVSDHGMIATSERRLVFLEDYVDTAVVRFVESGPFITLALRASANADSVLGLLAAAPHVRLYRSDRAPAAWRYPPGPRVPPIVGVAEDGWLMTTRARLARRGNRFTGGEHGFDPASPGMRALFVASGPAFRRGAVVEPFSNIHVYELMCRLLGVRPAPNDGSLDSTRAVLR